MSRDPTRRHEWSSSSYKEGRSLELTQTMNPTTNERTYARRWFISLRDPTDLELLAFRKQLTDKTCVYGVVTETKLLEQDEFQQEKMKMPKYSKISLVRTVVCTIMWSATNFGCTCCYSVDRKYLPCGGNVMCTYLQGFFHLKKRVRLYTISWIFSLRAVFKLAPKQILLRDYKRFYSKYKVGWRVVFEVGDVKVNLPSSTLSKLPRSLWTWCANKRPLWRNCWVSWNTETPTSVTETLSNGTSIHIGSHRVVHIYDVPVLTHPGTKSIAKSWRRCLHPTLTLCRPNVQRLTNLFPAS